MMPAIPAVPPPPPPGGFQFWAPLVLYDQVWTCVPSVELLPETSRYLLSFLLLMCELDESKYHWYSSLPCHWQSYCCTLAPPSELAQRASPQRLTHLLVPW